MLAFVPEVQSPRSDVLVASPTPIRHVVETGYASYGQDRIEDDGRAESFLVALARVVPEHDHEDASVGVKLSSRRGLGRGQRISGRHVIPLDDEPRS